MFKIRNIAKITILPRTIQMNQYFVLKFSFIKSYKIINIIVFLRIITVFSENPCESHKWIFSVNLSPSTILAFVFSSCYFIEMNLCGILYTVYIISHNLYGIIYTWLSLSTPTRCQIFWSTQWGDAPHFIYIGYWNVIFYRTFVVNLYKMLQHLSQLKSSNINVVRK